MSEKVYEWISKLNFRRGFNYEKLVITTMPDYRKVEAVVQLLVKMEP